MAGRGAAVTLVVIAHLTIIVAYGVGWFVLA